MRQRKRTLRKRYFLLGLGGLALVLAVSVSIWRLQSAPAAAAAPADPPAAETQQPSAPAASVPEPSADSGTAAVSPAAPAAGTTPQPQPAEYDYTQPVPAADAVDESWFKDAIFIGDSRTEGFALYSGLDCTSYTRKGIMVDTLFTEAAVSLNGKRVPIMDAVAAAPNFKKAYVMMGMNELGWPYLDKFIEKYAAVVEALRRIAPDAQIYIQSILPVTKDKSAGDKIYNNTNISKFNTAIRQMAQDEKVYYLDVAAGLAEADGALPADQAPDGVHLRTAGCKLWLQYLETHTVKEEP